MFDAELDMRYQEADRDANVLTKYQHFVEYCDEFLPQLMGILCESCNQDYLAGDKRADAAPTGFFGRVVD